MELQSLLDCVLENFNLGIILSINVLVYGLIQLIGSIIHKKVSKLIKVIITIFTSIILGFIYYKLGNIDVNIVLNSCICATLVWDWFLKPIVSKLGIDYEEKETYEEKS